ncbi:hypothetical protein Tco_0627051 [Tanacetum coccineum]|uniref:MAK10-like protein n=1 Tax=Tanacetum coccineum TaxID=301880 RepID=A0ABQ4WLE1_9ASTR
MITSESCLYYTTTIRIRKIREIDTLLESLNLTASPLKKDPSCLKGDVGFVKLFKTYEIGDVSEEELEEEEEVVEVDELGVEYFDKFPTRDDWIMKRQLEPRIYPEDLRRIRNFTRRIRGMHIFVQNFTYIMEFLIVEDISSAIDPCLSQVVLGKPFVKVSNMTYDPSLG